MIVAIWVHSRDIRWLQHHWLQQTGDIPDWLHHMAIDVVAQGAGPNGEKGLLQAEILRPLNAAQQALVAFNLCPFCGSTEQHQVGCPKEE